MAAVNVRRWLLILFVMTLGAVGVAWWLWSPILGPYPFGAPRPVLPRRMGASARIYATTLPSLEVDRLALADAMDRLRDGSGVRIVVNWRALEASGVNKDAPVSLHPPCRGPRHDASVAAGSGRSFAPGRAAWV